MLVFLGQSKPFAKRTTLTSTSRSNDHKQSTILDFHFARHESRLSNPRVLMAGCILLSLSKRIDKDLLHFALKGDGIVQHHPTTILEAIEQ
jgi:uncharacterized protein YijF (DUF1287 family)